MNRLKTKVLSIKELLSFIDNGILDIWLKEEDSDIIITNDEETIEVEFSVESVTGPNYLNTVCLVKKLEYGQEINRACFYYSPDKLTEWIKDEFQEIEGQTTFIFRIIDEITNELGFVLPEFQYGFKDIAETIYQLNFGAGTVDIKIRQCNEILSSGEKLKQYLQEEDIERLFKETNDFLEYFKKES